jgi:hypothetical protein
MISKVESLFSHNIAFTPYMSRIFDIQYAYARAVCQGPFQAK